MSASGSSLGGISAAASSGVAGPPGMAMAIDACSAPSRSPIASIPVPTRAIAPISSTLPTTSLRRGRLERPTAGAGAAPATAVAVAKVGAAAGQTRGGVGGRSRQLLC